MTALDIGLIILFFFAAAIYLMALRYAFVGKDSSFAALCAMAIAFIAYAHHNALLKVLGKVDGIIALLTLPIVIASCVGSVVKQRIKVGREEYYTADIAETLSNKKNAEISLIVELAHKRSLALEAAKRRKPKNCDLTQEQYKEYQLKEAKSLSSAIRLCAERIYTEEK